MHTATHPHLYNIHTYIYCTYVHLCYNRRFQDVKDYADEIEGIFKSLLEIREVCIYIVHVYMYMEQHIIHTHALNY